MEFYRLRSVLPAVVALALLLAGCGRLPSLSPDQERRQQAAGDWIITLDSGRNPLINENQILRVTLTDRRGRPIDNASIYFDLEMDMICLSGSKPFADPLGAGSYQVVTVYPMAGDWRVTVVAEHDGDERKVTFPITVRDPNNADGLP